MSVANCNVGEAAFALLRVYQKRVGRLRGVAAVRNSLALCFATDTFCGKL